MFEVGVRDAITSALLSLGMVLELVGIVIEYSQTVSVRMNLFAVHLFCTGRMAIHCFSSPTSLTPIGDIHWVNNVDQIATTPTHGVALRDGRLVSWSSNTRDGICGPTYTRPDGRVIPWSSAHPDVGLSTTFMRCPVNVVAVYTMGNTIYEVLTDGSDHAVEPSYP